MKPRISMVSLGVRDLERSRRFYGEGLGFHAIESPPSVAFYDLNGSWLALCSREELAADVGMSPEGSGYTAINLAHNVKSQNEVEAVMAEAERAGAVIVKAPVKADWGGYHGYFADPDGHLWEVAHNPFFWVGPEDI